MRKRRKFLTGLVLVALAFSAFAGIAYAADSTGTANSATNFVNGCRGFFGGVAAELSKLLGLSPEQIAEKRQAGESLADIAKDRGVSEDQVIDTMINARKKILDERVKAGIITQEQENAILDRMRTNMSARIKDPAIGPGAGGCGGCIGGGPGAGFGCGPGARGGAWGGQRTNPPANQSTATGSI